MTRHALPNTKTIPCPTAHDFAPRPLSIDGELDRETIFLAVGKSLSAWALVEYQLSRIYGGLLQTDSPAADRSLAAIMSFAGRIDVVRAAMNTALKDEGLKNEIEVFFRTAKSASARRNEIAHGHAVGLFRFDKNPKFFLMPQYIHPGKYDLLGDGEKYRFNAQEIAALAEKFENLGMHLLDLSIRISRAMPSWQRVQRAQENKKSPDPNSDSGIT